MRVTWWPAVPEPSGPLCEVPPASGAERPGEPRGHQPIVPLPEMSARAMTMRWTSLVPSPIAISGASR